MRLLSEKTYTPLTFITTMAAIVVAGILVLLGAVPLGAMVAGMDVGNYLSPEFPERALSENAVASIAMLLCAVILAYSAYRPMVGGIILCVYSAIFGFVFNAFHLCTKLYPTRGAMFFPSWSAVTLLLLLLGVLFIIRAKRDAGKPGWNTGAPA
jgi:hypothetical protein